MFFEPEVHTKEATAISNEGAQLSAVWVEGTEDILEKGFEYWPKISGVRSATRATHVTAVIVKGNETSVTLEGLEAGTEYAYRSYMRTVSGTFYGEEMTFKTPLMGDANNDGKVDSNDIDIITHYIVTGDIKGFNFKNADMNNDQKVNVADIVELNKQIGKK